MVVSCEICFIFSVPTILTLLSGVVYSFFLNLCEISEVKLVVKNLPANAGDASSIPGSERTPGEMATQSSILSWKTPWTGRAWLAIVHGVIKESDMT